MVAALPLEVAFVAASKGKVRITVFEPAGAAHPETVT
jgi:hypothetical protein